GHGQLHLLGRSFDMDAAPSPAEGESAGFINWLSAQRQIVLRDAVIRWTDQSRHAPTLVLSGVTLNIANHAGDHRFSLLAVPSPELGGLLDVRGTFRQAAAAQDQAFTLGGG